VGVDISLNNWQKILNWTESGPEDADIFLSKNKLKALTKLFCSQVHAEMGIKLKEEHETVSVSTHKIMYWEIIKLLGLGLLSNSNKLIWKISLDGKFIYNLY
jgi:hypothetical protein